MCFRGRGRESFYFSALIQSLDFPGSLALYVGVAPIPIIILMLIESSVSQSLHHTGSRQPVLHSRGSAYCRARQVWENGWTA